MVTLFCGWSFFIFVSVLSP